MVSASECKQRMDERYWPAVERKGAINSQFQASTEIKNKPTRCQLRYQVNIIQSCFLAGLFNSAEMESSPRYTFKKEEKLKSRKAIELLFRNGRSFSSFPMKVYWQFTEKPANILQAGFSTSSKKFKSSVDRNRIKRLMREAFRLQKNILIAKLKIQNRQMVVFFIYVGNDVPEHPLVSEKITVAVNRLIKITDENIQANT